MGRIENVRWRVAVHHHLAGENQHFVALRRFKDGVNRTRRGGAEDRGRGRAVALQLVDEEFSNALRVCPIVELRFSREGVLVQPLQQLRAVSANDLDLRIVDMRVNEARQQDRIGIVVYRNFSWQLLAQRAELAERHYAAVADPD